MNNITLKCVEWLYFLSRNLIYSLSVKINVKLGSINCDAFCKIMEKLSQQSYIIVDVSYLTVLLSMFSDVSELQQLMFVIHHLESKIDHKLQAS